MTFSIKFKSEQIEELFGERCQRCEIRIDQFSEEFTAPIEYWGPDQYRQQWIEGVKMILNGGAKGFLVASMRNPKDSDFISIFCLYRYSSKVFVQNHIILCEGNEVAIMEGRILEFVEDRETETVDGDEISEWETSISSLRSFIEG